ncbi:MAG: hypothetical protein M3Z84_02260 [Actinomycetota bacterium]|nr:hypothetical protein [Actinomycetota bacterium]
MGEQNGSVGACRSGDQCIGGVDSTTSFRPLSLVLTGTSRSLTISYEETQRVQKAGGAPTLFRPEATLDFG